MFFWNSLAFSMIQRCWQFDQSVYKGICLFLRVVEAGSGDQRASVRALHGADTNFSHFVFTRLRAERRCKLSVTLIEALIWFMNAPLSWPRLIAAQRPHLFIHHIEGSRVLTYEFWGCGHKHSVHNKHLSDHCGYIFSYTIKPLSLYMTHNQ